MVHSRTRCGRGLVLLVKMVEMTQVRRNLSISGKGREPFYETRELEGESGEL